MSDQGHLEPNSAETHNGENKDKRDSGMVLASDTLSQQSKDAVIQESSDIIEPAPSANMEKYMHEEKDADLESVVSFEKDVELNQEVEEWKPQKQEWFIMASLSMISLMVALDATILVAVLPSIATALNGSSIDAFWAGTSYLLSSAVFQPVIASVSENFGRQQLLLLSISMFTIGSILCAVANDFTVLLTGRTIQGVGGGGIITMSQVIFCDIVPLRQRPKYFALVLGAWSLGSIIGPVMGGAISEHLNWRWIFYINFPFCFLGFILGAVFVRLNAVTRLTIAQKLQRTDWIGAALFLAGATSFLIGISWGGIQHPWSSFKTLGPIILGLSGVVLFALWQRFVCNNIVFKFGKRSFAPKSLLPMSLFYCRSALAAYYCALINGLVLFTGLYYYPFFCMSVRSASPTRSGIFLFPTLFFLLPGSAIVAALTTRLGRFRWAIWGGWAVSTLGAGLWILFDVGTHEAVQAVALAIFGIGAGMILSSVNVGIQAISRTEDCAMAACLYGFMRSLGMPIGVALSSTIFQNAMSSKLSSLGLPTAIAHDSERYVEVLRHMQPTDPIRLNTEKAYVHGFQGVWMLMVIVSASAGLISLCIKKFDMDKSLKSTYTARR